MKTFITILAALIMFGCANHNPPLGPVLEKPASQTMTLHVHVYCKNPDGFVKRVSGTVWFAGQTFTYFATMRDTFISAQNVTVNGIEAPDYELTCKYTNISTPNDPEVDILVWAE